MQKIRVLECIRQGSIGGGESHMLMLTEELDRSMFDPVVLSFTGGPMIEKIAAKGIPYHVIHTVKAFDFFVERKIRQLFQSEKIDLVHAHGTRACSNVIRTARQLGIPVVYTIHGWSFHPDQNRIVNTLRIAAEGYLVSKTNTNISVSASNQQTGMNVIRNFKSVVINNGIDLDRFNPNMPNRNLRQEWNIPADAIVVIFIARFTSHKQPIALLQAFKEVLKQCENIYLVMVGDGDQKKDAEHYMHQNNMENRVILEPFRDDVPDLLSNADIYILPSLWEGLPIGLLEAMAMGKAVIATNVDGTREIIKDQENGLLVDPSLLKQQLPKSIITLCQNPDLCKTLSNNAILSMKNGFGGKEMTRKIEKVYLDTLQIDRKTN